MQVPVQLSLSVSLNEDTTFNNFYSSSNHLALQALETFANDRGDNFLLVWGRPGCGVSHLLQACCHHFMARGANVVYLPLKELQSYSPAEVLEGLDALDAICIDDIELVLGKAEWEQALFHLYNRLKDAGKRLLLGAHRAPGALGVQLADLQSRVLGCVIFQLQELSDSDKCQALKMRASARGMGLSDEVVTFVLNRAARSTQELFRLLDLLDQASLQQQRKITVPFVKSVLNL